jgi:hypothetical protein
LIRWFLSLFRRRPAVSVSWRTCDSVSVNRKFNKPNVWYSEEHLAQWVYFLRARCREGLITPKKLYEKIRAAVRSCREQRRRVGFLPGDHGDPDGHYAEMVRCELQRKANVSKGPLNSASDCQREAQVLAGKVNTQDDNSATVL